MIDFGTPPEIKTLDILEFRRVGSQISEDDVCRLRVQRLNANDVLQMSDVRASVRCSKEEDGVGGDENVT